MRQTCLILVCCVVLTASCAAKPSQPVQQQVIPVSSLAQNEAQREAMVQALQEGKSMVLHFEAGQSLPLQLHIDTPVFELAKVRQDLIFKRDVYVRLSKEDTALSPDGKRWVGARDFAGIKTLFDIGKGTFSGAVEATQEEGAVVSLFLGMAPAKE